MSYINVKAFMGLIPIAGDVLATSCYCNPLCRSIYWSYNVGPILLSKRRIIKLALFMALLLIGQYCFARWRLSSVVVCNAAGGRAGRRARGQPTLHGGPVRLRPVWATPCSNVQTTVMARVRVAELRCINYKRKYIIVLRVFFCIWSTHMSSY